MNGNCWEGRERKLINMMNLEAFDWLVITVLAALVLSKLITRLFPKIGRKPSREEMEKDEL